MFVKAPLADVEKEQSNGFDAAGRFRYPAKKWLLSFSSLPPGGDYRAAQAVKTFSSAC
jgi:hypothetical protein